MTGGRRTLAVPSDRPGGMGAKRSGHFGRCDCFTLVDVGEGDVLDVRTADNPPHDEGGCLGPVRILASHGVDAIVVVGIGPRPLAGFRQAGIEVLSDRESPTVDAVVRAVLAGDVGPIQDSHVCSHH